MADVRGVDSRVASLESALRVEHGLKLASKRERDAQRERADRAERERDEARETARRERRRRQWAERCFRVGMGVAKDIVHSMSQELSYKIWTFRTKTQLASNAEAALVDAGLPSVYGNQRRTQGERIRLLYGGRRGLIEAMRLQINAAKDETDGIRKLLRHPGLATVVEIDAENRWLKRQLELALSLGLEECERLRGGRTE